MRGSKKKKKTSRKTPYFFLVSCWYPKCCHYFSLVPFVSRGILLNHYTYTTSRQIITPFKPFPNTHIYILTNTYIYSKDRYVTSEAKNHPFVCVKVSSDKPTLRILTLLYIIILNFCPPCSTLVQEKPFSYIHI